MYRYSWFLFAACCLPASSEIQQETMDFLIYDGKDFRQVKDGDPSQVKVKEWQIWLYERGKSTGKLSDTWGMITGKTAANVMSQLKRSQEFERTYERWAKVPENSTQLTHFNPLGPIARVNEGSTTPKSAIDAIRRIQQGRSTVKRILQIVSDTPGETNPYAGIGIPLREYADCLSKAQQELKKLTPMLLQMNDKTIHQIDDGIKQVTSALEEADSKLRAIQTQWTQLPDISVPQGKKLAEWKADVVRGSSRQQGRFRVFVHKGKLIVLASQKAFTIGDSQHLKDGQMTYSAVSVSELHLGNKTFELRPVRDVTKYWELVIRRFGDEKGMASWSNGERTDEMSGKTREWEFDYNRCSVSMSSDLRFDDEKTARHVVDLLNQESAGVKEFGPIEEIDVHGWFEAAVSWGK